MRSARFKLDKPWSLMTPGQKISYAKNIIKQGNIKSLLELERIFPSLYRRLYNDKGNLLDKLGIPNLSYFALIKKDSRQLRQSSF